MSGTRVLQFLSFRRLRDNSGSAAVEFAFVAPVFFLFLFAIIETGVMLFGQAAVMNATQDAARLIRTGQAQGKIDIDAFKGKICDGMAGLFSDCATQLQVDVQNYPSGFNANQSSPVDPATGVLDPTLIRNNAGGACDVVIVRAFYKYSIVTPMLKTLMQSNADGIKYLTGAAAFRNEPYGANAC